MALPETVSAGAAGHLGDHEEIHKLLNSAYLNVRDPDYGAAGDGTTDDTAAIQAAIDDLANGYGPANTVGGTVYLPNGVYKVSSALLLKNKVQLVGTGARASIIQAAAGFLSNVDVQQNTTTLSAAITTTSETSITVTSASAFPPHGTFKIKIDTEILHVTAGNGTTTWTVIRGRDGTTAATHLNAATVKEVISRVVEFGDGVSDVSHFAFGSRLTDLDVDGNDVALTTCVFTQQGNEQCGIQDCLINGYRQYGVYWAPGASILRVRDAEVYGHSNGATYGVYSRAWGQNACINVTSIGTGAGSLRHAADFCVVASDTSVIDCHAEGAVDGFYGGLNAISLVVQLIGHSSVDNLLHISGNTEWVTAHLLDANSATNILIDDLAGLTVTSANEGVLRSYNQRSTRIGKAIIRAGTGTPEAAVTAAVGSLFLRTDGAANTTLYIKQTGTGNTGWAAVTP
jgi:hypothetical protein